MLEKLRGVAEHIWEQISDAAEDEDADHQFEASISFSCQGAEVLKQCTSNWGRIAAVKVSSAALATDSPLFLPPQVVTCSLDC